MLEPCISINNIRTKEHLIGHQNKDNSHEYTNLLGTKRKLDQPHMYRLLMVRNISGTVGELLRDRAGIVAPYRLCSYSVGMWLNIERED